MNSQHSQDSDNRLRDAARAGEVDAIVRAIRDGANVNARDEGGETALTDAAGLQLGAEKALACVVALLSAGARVAEEQVNGGLGTSVHKAAANGYTEALRELLSADGRAALEQFDDGSRTPLIAAAKAGHIAGAALLLEAGADVNAHDLDMAGDPALSYAIEDVNVPMVELLLRYGADPDIQGWMRISPLDRARRVAWKNTSSEAQRIWQLVHESHCSKMR